MPKDTAHADLDDMPDLEKRILTVLSMFEAGSRLENADEYILSDGRRVKATLEGVRSFLKDSSSIDMEKMLASAEQLLLKKLVTIKSNRYFLSNTGRKVGKRLRIKQMRKGYDNLLLRTGKSKAYSIFCERVFGKDLSQFNVLDMKQLGTLIKKLELKPGEVALDLGCGNGRIAEYISDFTGAKVIGLDFAAELIGEAQRRTIDKRNRLSYVVGNMDELLFEEKSFDAIISIDTLYFVENIDLTIRKLKSLLRPFNGRLAIFYDQACGPSESREILLPENTKIGAALTSSGLAFDTVDYTDSSRGIWIREIEAAEDLKEMFEKEGNADIYADRAQDAKRTLETIENGRQVRHFYLARSRSKTPKS